MIINWGDAPFKAFITVTYPNGTCTVSGNGQTYTHSGGGTTTFTVKKKGTYTVNGVGRDGKGTGSKSVTITEKKQTSSVSLSYQYTLYASNTAYVTFVGTSHKNDNYGGASYNTSTLALEARSGWGGSSYAIISTASAIDVTDYKTITFTLSSFSSNGTAKVGIASSSLSRTFATSASPTSATTVTVSLASITGSYYPTMYVYGMHEEGFDYPAQDATMRVSKIVLST